MEAAPSGCTIEYQSKVVLGSTSTRQAGRGEAMLAGSSLQRVRSAWASRLVSSRTVAAMTCVMRGCDCKKKHLTTLVSCGTEACKGTKPVLHLHTI